jgi:tight adherence protein C
MNSFFLATGLSLSAAYLLVATESGDEGKALEFSRKKYRGLATNLPDRTQLKSRLLELNRLGKNEYFDFRSSQISTSALVSLISALLIWGKSSNAVLALIGGFALGYLTFVIIDRNLTKLVMKRRVKMEGEFPALIEMLTLSISAGQTPLNAMAAIATRSDCELAKEFALVTRAVIAGAPFHIALDSMGRRIKSVTIRRFIDAMITAMLRGAPIVEVLQRHAQESRVAHRNQIMAAAGKAEIAMMIPVVFLILPVSMLFALWPSLSNLNGFM